MCRIFLSIYLSFSIGGWANAPFILCMYSTWYMCIFEYTIYIYIYILCERNCLRYLLNRRKNSSRGWYTTNSLFGCVRWNNNVTAMRAENGHGLCLRTTTKLSFIFVWRQRNWLSELVSLALLRGGCRMGGAHTLRPIHRLGGFLISAHTFPYYNISSGNKQLIQQWKLDYFRAGIPSISGPFCSTQRANSVPNIRSRICGYDHRWARHITREGSKKMISPLSIGQNCTANNIQFCRVEQKCLLGNNLSIMIMACWPPPSHLPYLRLLAFGHWWISHYCSNNGVCACFHPEID